MAEAAEDAELVSMPLLRLIHGLPGGGRSQLFEWIRDYFDEVWQCQYGREFASVAQLNTMAAGVRGQTVYSFGNVAYKDKRGQLIIPHDSSDVRDVLSMSIKCGALRWLFFGEVEATGAETFGLLEQNVRFHISSKSKYKRTHNVGRAFGGVNTIFLGDFWQLRPTGQIPLMSNPFAAKAQENARAREIMGMFWFSGLSFSLQPWESNTRMIHLQKNERSGEDTWFSSFECLQRRMLRTG